MKKIVLLILINLFSFFYAQYTVAWDFDSSVNDMKYLGVWNNKAYFTQTTSYSSPRNLVSYDGVTAQIVGTVPNEIKKIKRAGNGLYLQTSFDLYFFDGTNINALNTKSSSFKIGSNNTVYSLNNESHIGNDFYFFRNDPNTSNYKLWKSSGTLASTVQVDNTITLTGNDTSGIDDILAFNGEIYFHGDNASGVHGLYKYSNNTVTLIKQMDIRRLGTVFKDKLYFQANPYFIYQTDGTTAGTISYGISGGQESVNFQKNSNSMLLSSVSGPYIYITDGPQNTLRKLMDKTVVYGSSSVSAFIDDEYAYITESNGQSTPGFLSRIKFSDGSVSTMNVPGTMTVWNFTAENDDIFNYNGNYHSKLHNGVFYATYGTGGVNHSNPMRADGVSMSVIHDYIADNLTYSVLFGNFFSVNNQIYYLINKPRFSFANEGYYIYRFDQDFTFNNSVGNNNWNTPSNWNAGSLPLSSDNTIIPASQNPQITGNAFANNLTVSSPINLTSGNLNVAGNLNLGSSLTLNNNNLNLIASNSQITNGNSTNYIVTNGTGTVNVQNLNAARGAVSLPIGTANQYNPIKISNSGTPDTFSARVSEGIANAPGGAVNATWDISEGTPGGSNATISLGWNASQQNGTFNPNNATVGHYVNGVWTAENSGAVSGSNPYTITGSGITSFSPFGVMNLGALATADPLRKNISVYPNLFREILTFTSEDKATVHFYDMTGKMVGSHALVKGTNVLNPAALKPGVYLYQVKNTSGIVMASGKVIKK